MSVTLAKQDTATIRKALNYTDGRPYSEKRAYGRRVKFWYGKAPLNGNIAKTVAALKEAFGDRFIDCGSFAGPYGGIDFEVKLRNWK